MSHTSKFSERETVAIMANCKKAYGWVRERDAAIAKTIESVEAAILKDPSETFKHLLLQVYSNHGRGKCVATIQKATDTMTKDGLLIWENISVERLIKDNEDWIVSVVKGGTSVRVHLSPKAAADVEAELDDRVATEPSKYRNVRVY